MIAARPRSPLALRVPKGSPLVTALEILMVTACLALGAAFVGSLRPGPAAPAAEASRTCAPGTASC